MTVRRLLSTRDSMYVKLRLFLKYTRESTACLLNKPGPLRKRESLDQTWPACYTVHFLLHTLNFSNAHIYFATAEIVINCARKICSADTELKLEVWLFADLIRHRPIACE